MQAAKDRREKLKAAREARSQEKQQGKRRVVEMEQITKKEMRHQIEDVKFKVQQYGLQSYTPEERRKRERARLIKLGAKAPKAEWKNYKGIFLIKIISLINNSSFDGGEEASSYWCCWKEGRRGSINGVYDGSISDTTEESQKYLLVGQDEKL